MRKSTVATIVVGLRSNQYYEEVDDLRHLKGLIDNYSIEVGRLYAGAEHCISSQLGIG